MHDARPSSPYPQTTAIGLLAPGAPQSESPTARLHKNVDEARQTTSRLEELADRLVGAVPAGNADGNGSLNAIPSSIAQSIHEDCSELGALTNRINGAISRIETQF